MTEEWMDKWTEEQREVYEIIKDSKVTVNLVTKENGKFKIQLAHIFFMSGLIRDMIELDDTKEIVKRAEMLKKRKEKEEKEGKKEEIEIQPPDEIEIPLPNLTNKGIIPISEYAKHHFENLPDPLERPLKSRSIKNIVSKWDYEFIKNPKLNQQMQVRLIKEANYLDIEPLLSLLAINFAESLKGKTPAEIGDIFGFSNDFTPEEEAKIIEENKHCVI